MKVVITPLYDRVLVEVLGTHGGEGERVGPSFGRVLAVGMLCIGGSIYEGALVLFGKYAGTELPFNQVLLRSDEILATMHYEEMGSPT